jgi:hypothetical protein
MLCSTAHIAGLLLRVDDLRIDYLRGELLSRDRAARVLPRRLGRKTTPRSPESHDAAVSLASDLSTTHETKELPAGSITSRGGAARSAVVHPDRNEVAVVEAEFRAQMWWRSTGIVLKSGESPRSGASALPNALRSPPCGVPKFGSACKSGHSRCRSLSFGTPEPGADCPGPS